MAEPLSGADRISAYVDGEMSPHDAADIAAEIARDPVLARTVAQYQAMRAQVAAIGSETVVITLPDTIRDRAAPWYLRAGLGAALAATMVALTVGGMWWADALRPGIGAASVQMAAIQELDIAAIVADFDATLGVAVVPTAGSDPKQVEQTDPIAPLMKSNGLRQIAVTRMTLPSGEIAVARKFAGASGCHIGLYIRTNVAGQPPTMQIIDNGQTLLAQWADTGSRYTLVSRSMDPARFATLALALRRATGAPDKTHPDLLLALTEARQPCLG